MELGGRPGLAPGVERGAFRVMKILPATTLNPLPAGFQDSRLQCVTGVLAKFGGRPLVLFGHYGSCCSAKVPGFAAKPSKGGIKPEPALQKAWRKSES